MNVKKDRRNKLKNSVLYNNMKRFSIWLDHYYIDAAMGVLPWGIGDIVSAMMACVYIYFSLVHLRSFSLTWAIIYNILKDVCIGLIPFYVGDVLDVFNKSNIRNIYLIDGFIEQDKAIMKTLQKEKWIFIIGIFSFFIAILVLIKLSFWIVSSFFSFIL